MEADEREQTAGEILLNLGPSTQACQTALFFQRDPPCL